MTTSTPWNTSSGWPYPGSTAHTNLTATATQYSFVHKPPRLVIMRQGSARARVTRWHAPPAPWAGITTPYSMDAHAEAARYLASLGVSAEVDATKPKGKKNRHKKKGGDGAHDDADDGDAAQHTPASDGDVDDCPAAAAAAGSTSAATAAAGSKPKPISAAARKALEMQEKVRAEEERRRLAAEAEAARLEAQRVEAERAEAERLARLAAKKDKKKAKAEAAKADGTYRTPAQKAKDAAAKVRWRWKCNSCLLRGGL